MVTVNKVKNNTCQYLHIHNIKSCLVSNVILFSYLSTEYFSIFLFTLLTLCCVSIFMGHYYRAMNVNFSINRHYCIYFNPSKQHLILKRSFLVRTSTLQNYTQAMGYKKSTAQQWTIINKKFITGWQLFFYKKLMFTFFLRFFFYTHCP